MDYISLDITVRKQYHAVLTKFSLMPHIHCAAWTAVDAAEDAENQEKVHRIMADGTAYIAAACKEIGAKMMYISTVMCLTARARSLGAGLQGIQPLKCIWKD